MKILVVDDSQTMRKIIRNALEDMGYSASSIIEATDGVEAMRELRDRRFKVDVILADTNMPNMDGLALLRELQVGEVGGVRIDEDIPFIMVTDEAQPDRVVEAICAGARDYIVKPFTSETLREKILAVEMELLNRRKPTDTTVMRLHFSKAPDRQPVGPDDDLPFLAQLPEELVAAICVAASISEHEKGEVLMRPGDIVQQLHIIEMGEVEIHPSSDGRPSDVCGRGECFGEVSFLSGDPAGPSARARTEVTVASVGKGDFEDLLAKYPHLSFYLARLLAKRARKADAELTLELEKGFSGRLSTISLPDLVQTLHNSRKTGLLRVYQDRALRSRAPPSTRSRRACPEHAEGRARQQDRSAPGSQGSGFLLSGGDEGEIYFVDGDVRHAQTGGQRGEEAFYQLASWMEGSFAFETGSRRIEHGIFRATVGLLIEAMRRQDELRKMPGSLRPARPVPD